MEEPKRSRREFWFVVAAGSSLMLLTGAGAYWIKSSITRPQLGFEVTGNEDLLRLPEAYGLADNKAVGDLLESLPPDLALEVCAGLTDAPARSAKRTCDALRRIAAVAPAAAPIEPASAVTAEAGATVMALVEGQRTSEARPIDTVAVAAAPMPVPGEPSSVAVEEPDAVPTKTAAAATPPSAAARGLTEPGVEIARAQTTETAGVQTALTAEDLDLARLPKTSEPTVPTASLAGDEAMAYWLLFSGVPDGDAAGATSGAETTNTGPASAVAAAAAKTLAEAKARAAAEARARAAAAARRATAIVGGGKDTDRPGPPGRGKDKDQDSSGGEGSAGGGNND